MSSAQWKPFYPGGDKLTLAMLGNYKNVRIMVADALATHHQGISCNNICLFLLTKIEIVNLQLSWRFLVFGVQLMCQLSL